MLIQPLAAGQLHHLLLVQVRQEAEVIGVQVFIDRERRLLDPGNSGDILLISQREFRGNSGDILLISQRSSRHGSAVRAGMAGGGEAMRKDEIARLANGLDESFSASLRLRARNNPFRHKDGQCPAVNLSKSAKSADKQQ
jgi:hypothetical protein